MTGHPAYRAVPEGLSIPHRIEESFTASPDQIPLARHAVAQWLADCPVRDEVLLIFSELATNAVPHSRSKDRGHFTLRVEIHGGNYLWIEIEDAGGPWRTHPPDSERGHGLQIVEALSSKWGIEEIGSAGLGGRVVWARLEL